MMKGMTKYLAVALLCAAAFHADAVTKVACVGNSITFGMKIPDREVNSYPSQLQRMLGDGYEVGNFGHSGATLMNRGYNPYMKLPEFRAALDFKPDIVVVHLGVNDTDPRTWPNYAEDFVTDYLALIDSFKVVNSAARVILANISPVNATHRRFRSGTRDWRLDVRDAVARTAQAAGAELIDFETPLLDRRDLLPDGLHPNAEGAGLLAETVRGAITGNYGGLSMAPVYQSGMVLQRDIPLRIGGRADAGERVTLTLDGETYSAVADNRGLWEVVTLPVVTGPTYEMVVTAGGRTLRFSDILAGEVWLASGQSNMAFTLAEETGAREVIASADDPELRFFNMRPVAATANVEWPDSVRALVDRLGYFREARWQPVTPADAGGLSAVAYHFAKQLRDSLDVPVGVISNAVGGAPAEAWISVEALEREMPEALNDWRKNDYVQKWCQERATKNSPTGRHPYEPSYLFAAGIRPLDSYPVAGVIWYQGESNAHNIEIHEKLFPLLVADWREYFADSSLPFYFVQLSSIDRHSWPRFRDSQRRMARRLPHVAMAVSSDLGDSLDVHPKNKRPVGERLGLLALRDSYGRDIVASGPDAVRAVNRGDAVAVTFANGAGMSPASGDNIIGFEVAEIEGLYYPASAVVESDSVVVVSSDKVGRPRFVRYAWQPFTRANLVNDRRLPASTFRLEVENPDVAEAGYKFGVSAPFAGVLDGRLVMAGGCNFPEKPLAKDSRKRFYKGIYVGDSLAQGGIRKIGELSAPTAYGATAKTSKGLILIGGIADGASLKDVWLLDIDGLVPNLTRLPSLPSAVDNMAAAAIGNVVYVAGGNIDGVPGNVLFALDLDTSAAGWKRLRDLPGNPRIQPVMAASNGNLFLWGGFAPAHMRGKKARQATLETDGLRYNPAKKRWSALPAPVNENGEAVSLGGGAACALPDGRIVAAGGVNKDIFLEALRDPAPDYLSHPAPWYRFNDNIFVFDPETSRWNVFARSRDAARAGAAMVPGQGNNLYIIGGEVKPQVRTPRISRYAIMENNE